MLARSRVGPLGYMLIVIWCCSFLGMLMDAVPIMIALAPLLARSPSSTASRVQFGIMFVVTCMVGLVTPPVGILLFMTSSIPGSSSSPFRGGDSVRGAG